MITILADADLPYLNQYFQKSFEIRTYRHDDELRDRIKDADVLLCRSTCRVTKSLLKDTRITCVATASSGTDHIDHNYLQSADIRLVDAKGSNAIAVADYVTATLAWLSTQGKITGKHAGLVGAGAVGTAVLWRLINAGFIVSIYDPYRAATDGLPHVNSLNALQTCDVLCLHPNLHHAEPYPSFNLIERDFISDLKSGVSIINASRGGVVNEADLLKASQRIHYCTDVFLKEPDINPDVLEFSTLCTPHIAGHSIEAKERAIMQVSQQLHTLYDLPHAYPAEKNNASSSLHLVDNWEATVLEQYNPHIETQILKSGACKKETFLALRRAHTQRYHFVNEPQWCYN